MTFCFRYDFRSLSKDSNNKTITYTVEHGKEKYEFGVCDLGAFHVEQDKKTSMGKVDDDLKIQAGVPILEYNYGAPCNSNSTMRTKLEFICNGKNSPKAEPKVIENKDCELVIQFPTELACQNEVSSSITDSKFDFVGLKNLAIIIFCSRSSAMMIVLQTLI